MFRHKSTKTNGLVFLNDEMVFIPQYRGMRLPVRVDERTAQRIIRATESQNIDTFSCLHSVSAEWTDGKLVINTTYNPRTKCKPSLYTKTRAIKTGICIEKICTGKCVDNFMCEIIAQHILPDLYKDKQR